MIPIGIRRYEYFKGQGIFCSGRGDDLNAKEHFERAVELAKTLSEKTLCEAYINLSIAQSNLRDYPEAKKTIQAAASKLSPADRGGELEALICERYGTISWRMGFYDEALESYEKELGIYRALSNEPDQARAHSHLGNVYLAKGAFGKAQKNFGKDLEISNRQRKKDDAMEASINLANSHLRIGSKKSLQKAKNIFEWIILNTPKGVPLHRKAKNGLANTYLFLKNYPRVISHYKDVLRSCVDPLQKGEFASNLSLAYIAMGKRREAKEWLRTSIEAFSALQASLPQKDWQISIFERQKYPFISLENLLVSERKFSTAVEVIDARLSRALVLSLVKKHSLAPEMEKTSFEEMKALADKKNTTFVLYSLTALPKLRIFVLSKDGIIFEERTLPSLREEIETFSKTITAITTTLRKAILEALGTSPYSVDDVLEKSEVVAELEAKGDAQSKAILDARKNWKTALTAQQNQLNEWYSALIPDCLQKKLPNHLTFIADRVLIHVPFAALWKMKDGHKHYLIEDCAISFTPSITVSKILDAQPETKIEKALLVRNPTKDLPNAEKESKAVAEHIDNADLSSKTLREDSATPAAFAKAITETPPQIVHLACHGTHKKKSTKHSVFGGALKLAGPAAAEYMYSEDILKLPLEAENVFLSACFSGRGEIHQEGNVGLVWAFLGAGAKAVVACHWPLYDSNLTVEMVKTYYQNIAKGTDKSIALQSAMKQAIDTDPDRPDKWALLFLSGETKSSKWTKPAAAASSDDDDTASFMEFGAFEFDEEA